MQNTKHPPKSCDLIQYQNDLSKLFVTFTFCTKNLPD